MKQEIKNTEETYDERQQNVDIYKFHINEALRKSQHTTMLLDEYFFLIIIRLLHQNMILIPFSFRYLMSMSKSTI